MINKTLITVFIFSQLLAPGQVQPNLSYHQIDSLQKLLPGSDIKENVDILNALAAHYAPINFDSSIMYSAQAVRLGSVYGYPLGIGAGRLNTGNAYYFKMDFKNALLSYLSALRIFEENNALKAMGNTYFQLGNINFLIRRSENAYSYYRKSLQYFRASGSESSLPAVYDAMSMAFYFMEYRPIDSALTYGYKMLGYAREHGDQYLENYALANIGMFFTVGESILMKQKALAYCDSAMKQALALENFGLIIIINFSLGNYYDRNTPFYDITGDLVLSRSYYEKAYQAACKVGSSYLEVLSLNYIARIDIEEKKYTTAEECLDLCEERLNDFFGFEWKNTPSQGYVVNYLGKIMDFFLAQRERNVMYHSGFKLAMAKGEYRKAVDNLQLYYQSKDSLNAAQQSQQLELLMAEAEAEKIDQKIRVLSRDNELSQLRLTQTRFIFAGGAAGLLIISLFLLLFFQRKRLKAEKNSHALEQKLLRSQMNPHFIFNSLASIQNFVVNQKASEASIYLARFSQLVRNILDSTVDESVPLQKEIETIQNYLELQKVRYSGQFEFSLTVDENIDKESMMIPPMLAQPFIENSIEHGIKYKETPGQIDIRFNLEGDLIRFEVEDNGVGREKAKEIEMKQKRIHRSMSTSITQERLIKLNKKMKHKIRMEIIDLKDNLGKACGTRVSFGIPVVVR